MALPVAEAPGAVLEIAAEADLIRVRQALRVQAQQAGLGLVDQTKFITAGSELARNILTYADGGRGRLRVGPAASRGRRGARAVFSDGGPGIADVEAALADGFSTSGSMGLGLPGARRLADEMTIESEPGLGTTVTVVKWAR